MSKSSSLSSSPTKQERSYYLQNCHPTLYRYAKERKYDVIPKHVTNSPNDIYWKDQYNCTALHILATPRVVTDELLQAVNSIITIDPTLIRQCNKAGYTPLHLAINKQRMQDDDNDDDDSRTLKHRDLVVSLIHACPEAVSIPMSQQGTNNKDYSLSNIMTTTPFHICCKVNGHIDIFRAMLHVNPSLVMMPSFCDNGNDSRRRNYYYTNIDNPLQVLWTSATKSMTTTTTNNSSSRRNMRIMEDLENKMELLLRASYCGSIVSTNATTTAVANNNNTIANHGARDDVVAPDTADAANTKDDDEESNDDNVSNENSTVHPDTTARNRRTATKTFHLLHAACSIRCPREYICRILERQSGDTEQQQHLVSTFDDDGYLPLHYACMSGDIDSQPYTEYLIESLLQLYPQGASVPYPPTTTTSSTSLRKSNYKNVETSTRGNTENDSTNEIDGSNQDTTKDDTNSIRDEEHDFNEDDDWIEKRKLSPPLPLLPLHVAITDCQMTWNKGGIKALVYAYPDAVRKVDPRNGLFPFQASAIHATRSKLHLSTTYELLLAAPEMITCRQLDD